MICMTCGQPIPPERLAVQPDAKQCVKCLEQEGDPRVKGVMIWDHKTAPYIEVGTQLAEAQTAKVPYGPHIRFNCRENPRTLRSMAAAQASREVADLVRESNGAQLRVIDPLPEFEVVTKNPARCHPERERVTLKGLCLECALDQQRKRMGR